MQNEDLICSRQGALTQFTLNRPSKANALSLELVESLLRCLDVAHHDGTRLLVITGAGSHFCAGFDFSGLEETRDDALALRFIRIETLLQRLYHAPFTTLVLAHGNNFGAGADLVVACDWRIIAPQASFRLPGLQFGVVLGTRRLSERIGSERARDVLSSARTVNAEEALRFGIATQICAREEWTTIIAEQTAHSELLTTTASVALRRLTTRDTRDQDMAELARSVSAPALKDRMLQFRSRTTAFTSTI